MNPFDDPRRPRLSDVGERALLQAIAGRAVTPMHGTWVRNGHLICTCGDDRCDDPEPARKTKPGVGRHRRAATITNPWGVFEYWRRTPGAPFRVEKTWNN